MYTILFFKGGIAAMTKRKTIQVKLETHARLDEFWKKLHLGFDYDRSTSGVIDYLMDFYDKQRTPEMVLALEMVNLAEKRVGEKYGQVDIFQAINKAADMGVFKLHESKG
jgi:hypothetical protein